MKVLFYIILLTCLPALVIIDEANSQNVDDYKNIGAATNLLLFSKKQNFVFLTSTTHTGNLGGLEGADKICQDLATSAGLPGKYMAWLSNETTSPATRFSQSTLPYVLVNGTQIANDWDDLTDGSLDAPITVDENLQTSYGKVVWSNTRSDGSQYDDRHHCDNWTRALPDVDRVETGNSHLTNSAWSLAYSIYSCNSTLRIYCFEQ